MTGQEMIAAHWRPYTASHYSETTERDVTVRLEGGRRFVTVRGEALDGAAAVMRALETDGEVYSWK